MLGVVLRDSSFGGAVIHDLLRREGWSAGCALLRAAGVDAGPKCDEAKPPQEEPCPPLLAWKSKHSLCGVVDQLLSVSID